MDDNRLSNFGEVATVRRWERRGFIKSIRERETGDTGGKILKVMETKIDAF